jgi:hypothetical protein
MKKVVRAEIKWFAPENGGRKSVMPIGMRYCPIIVFDDYQTGGTLWSAEVYNTKIEGWSSEAEITYLRNDGAPFHLLEKGNRFALYEGQRVIAEGIVA